jgi:hypothetical protein
VDQRQLPEAAAAAAISLSKELQSRLTTDKTSLEMIQLKLPAAAAAAVAAT